LQRYPAEGETGRAEGTSAAPTSSQGVAIAGGTLLEKRAMSSEKPDQIQASVAAALSRLRGDLGPTGAAAPKIDDSSAGGADDRPRPANDVRGDPFFRSIQSPPPGTGMARGPIPMTPFPRMQTPQEPTQQEPSPAETAKEDASLAPEASGTIEIPEMPEREQTAPEQVSMPEPPSLSAEPPTLTAAPQPAPQPSSGAAAATAAAAANPLARMMRSGQPGSAAPAQRDLLADLPPPPISEPLTADTESGAVRRKRRNRRLLAAAAVIVVVALGAWLWTGGEPSTEVPVITADATPEKVKPAEGQEGGLQVQNQNVQVLDPSTQAQGETVMPEPEQPITPPAASEAPAADQAPTVVENTAPDSNAAPTAQAPDVAPSPDVPLSETPLPAMEDNGTTEVAPAAPATTTPEPTQTAETPATSEPAPAQDTIAEVTQTPAPATPAPAPAPAAQPEPAQAAQPEAAPAAQPEQPTTQAEQPAAQEAPTQQAAVTPSAPTGNTRVQLAAGKSEASVQKEWAALQKAHPDLLGGLSLTIERVDKGDAGIFYRLQAGPLADKTAAKPLGTSLKQKGQDCLVVAK
jgi:hypothetical protein